MKGLQEIAFIAYTFKIGAEMNNIFTDIINGNTNPTIGRIAYNTLKDRVATDILTKTDLPIEEVYRGYFIDHDFEYYINKYEEAKKG